MWREVSAVDFGPHLDNWKDLGWCQVCECYVVRGRKGKDVTFPCHRLCSKKNRS